MVHKARCHLAKMLSGWISREAALGKGEAGDKGKGVMDFDQPWVEPSAADVSPRRLFFLNSKILLELEQLSAPRLERMDGQTGAYCALSSGAALQKYGREIQCFVSGKGMCGVACRADKETPAKNQELSQDATPH